MADQQFCLRWNNHQSTLISVFDTLLENGTLVDCTLAAEGQYLKAHKVVLCACSPYLETLLSQHYEKHPIVILKDVKFSELKSMMDYMYRGEVNICQDQLGTFLKAAESLQIKGLSDNGADGDARDVGSTPKAPPPRKANVPAPSNRPEPARPESPQTDGSSSPSLRKRRRVRRSSQDDDSHLENNSCDLPIQAQSTPVPNIPAAITSITTTPIVKPAIVKPEQTDINRIDTNSLPPDTLKKEIEPISEPLLEPKTEYLEDVNNEDSVEDLTLDDDDDMEGMDISNMSNMSNMSRPGPSHGNDISNQGFGAWNLGANQSGTDEVFMAAQEAVNQHRDSQGFIKMNPKKSKVSNARGRSGGEKSTSIKINCPHCDKKLTQTFLLKTHIQLFCKAAPRFIINARLDEYPRRCIFCRKLCRSKKTLRRHHIRDCNTDRTYTCNICDYDCAWMYVLHKHMFTKHPEVLEELHTSMTENIDIEDHQVGIEDENTPHGIENEETHLGIGNKEYQHDNENEEQQLEIRNKETHLFKAVNENKLATDSSNKVNQLLKECKFDFAKPVDVKIQTNKIANKENGDGNRKRKEANTNHLKKIKRKKVGNGSRQSMGEEMVHTGSEVISTRNEDAEDEALVPVSNLSLDQMLEGLPILSEEELELLKASVKKNLFMLKQSRI